MNIRKRKRKGRRGGGEKKRKGSGDRKDCLEC